jgi:hypothetical protein
MCYNNMKSTLNHVNKHVFQLNANVPDLLLSNIILAAISNLGLASYAAYFRELTHLAPTS